jgi:hypothetical protein
VIAIAVAPFPDRPPISCFCFGGNAEAIFPRLLPVELKFSFRFFARSCRIIYDCLFAALDTRGDRTCNIGQQ